MIIRLITGLILLIIILGAIYHLQTKDNIEQDHICKDCNVILIVIDALRQDHVGTYGYYRNTTPNIDKLAEKSIVFQNAISQDTWTKPSIATLFTSTYPTRHQTLFQITEVEGHVGMNQLPESLTTIAEIMSDNGYKTYGYVNNANIHPDLNFNQGFDEYERSLYDTQITKRIRTIIEKKDVDEKFFMYIHYLGPHGPYTPPGKYKSLFVEEDHEYINTSRKHRDIYDSLELSKRQIEYIIAQYDGEIRLTDQRVGNILSSLEEKGLMDKTIVIITSDHGESFNDPNIGRFGHGHIPYEGQILVPLIIHLPEK